MKTIKIKKNRDLSANSDIFLHIGSKKVLIKGFGLYPISVEQDEQLFATHLWTQSNKINYEEIDEESLYLIKPRMGKTLAFTILYMLIVCLFIFSFSKFKWSFLPLAPFVIYVGLYLSILKNRYLIIKSFKEE